MKNQEGKNKSKNQEMKVIKRKRITSGKDKTVIRTRLPWFISYLVLTNKYHAFVNVKGLFRIIAKIWPSWTRCSFLRCYSTLTLQVSPVFTLISTPALSAKPLQTGMHHLLQTSFHLILNVPGSFFNSSSIGLNGQVKERSNSLMVICS